MEHRTHPEIVSRLKRAEGHLRKIIGMIEEGRPCLELAQQLQAIENAIDNAKKALIHDHIDHCIDSSLKEPGRKGKASLLKTKAARALIAVSDAGRSKFCSPALSRRSVALAKSGVRGMTLLKRQLHSQRAGPSSSLGDWWHLVFDTETKRLCVEHAWGGDDDQADPSIANTVDLDITAYLAGRDEGPGQSELQRLIRRMFEDGPTSNESS
jgi:uncharacterized protein